MTLYNNCNILVNVAVPFAFSKEALANGRKMKAEYSIESVLSIAHFQEGN